MSRAVTTSTGRFETAPGIDIAYDLVRRGHDRLVILSHGIFGHRSLPELVTLAEHLSTQFDVLTLDCRGHGDSGGRFTFGLEEWRDLGMLADEMRASYSWIAGIGFSFGGFHTCVAAACVDCFDAVMLVSTPKNFSIADHLPSARGLAKSAPLMAGRNRKRTRVQLTFKKRIMPIQCIHEITVPLHIVHGDNDWLIHHRHALALHARAKMPCDLTILEGGIHAEYLVAQMPERFLDLVSGWLELVSSPSQSAPA